MDTGKSSSIPARLIFLDVIGTALLTIGLIEGIAEIDVLPDDMRFQGYETAFIVAGCVLMAPLLVHVVALVIRRARSASDDARPG
jgi:hypothetical protein